MRTIDDVIPKVSGSTHLSILDASSGFSQVNINEKSSRLCIFNSPWGKYIWKRLPCGLARIGDVFQEKMDMVFGKLEGLSGIADDTLVYCMDKAQHGQLIRNVHNAATGAL